ncbi:hypothetical protein ASPWEDRAFT_173006 [Aspergillus wentii DTO 134E9]|uniref:Cytochrome P450 n=1 Tax=Aspergillus wentii DTO 134E9 TaxID=1073089 RepID=A0A1L9RMW3_ASPWE|nr:uncharacterized protein ASPWEDRAFT_173006 [Aspergillus wentii DTO 134E9]OJJ36223.1 hypothetical protein ASPWEDRAFT_173006 [Aspergillus wentii DTO 134E9]
MGANLWVVHRSSRHFTNAGVFVPERWLGDQAFSSDDKAAFNPFMTGPRNCVGQKLADAELRLVLSRLVWNFNIELADPNEDWIAKHQVFTLWRKPELKVKLTPRQAR